MTLKISSICSDRLSFFRTHHEFIRYGEFHSCDEFEDYCNWARANGFSIYILGNGSNTFFNRHRISSLILKNKLPGFIRAESKWEIEVSSSSLIIDVLKYCYKNSLESFYYLASVPATIGGALAMNAGRGKSYNMTIYDFAKTIKFFNPNTSSIETISAHEAIKGYRETIFTGRKSALILSVVFEFREKPIDGNPILERCKWSKENQDYSAANCGSVFKESDSRILRKIRGLSLKKASFSSKTDNWILNDSGAPINIVFLIKIASFLHHLLGKKIELEIIQVD